jgi:hypothetical protein
MSWVTAGKGNYHLRTQIGELKVIGKLWQGMALIERLIATESPR